MALTNNGEIGTQGTASQASGNKWVDNVFVNCDQWGPAGILAPWQTYCENSNADNSFLWVIQDQLTIPEFNPFYNTGSGISVDYFWGPSSKINFAPVNRLMDCIYDPFAPIPPTWKLVGAGQANSPANSYKFRIYPNPTSSELTIESLESLDEVQVELYSIAGVLIKAETQQNKHQIDLRLDDLPPTLYFVVLKSKGQTLYTSKVIKAQ